MTGGMVSPASLNGSIVPMKYALCAVILAAFSATCYYGATEGSREEARASASEQANCQIAAKLMNHPLLFDQEQIDGFERTLYKCRQAEEFGK